MMNYCSTVSADAVGDSREGTGEPVCQPGPYAFSQAPSTPATPLCSGSECDAPPKRIQTHNIFFSATTNAGAGVFLPAANPPAPSNVSKEEQSSLWSLCSHSLLPSDTAGLAAPTGDSVCEDQPPSSELMMWDTPSYSDPTYQCTPMTALVADDSFAAPDGAVPGSRTSPSSPFLAHSPIPATILCAGKASANDGELIPLSSPSMEGALCPPPLDNGHSMGDANRLAEDKKHSAVSRNVYISSIPLSWNTNRLRKVCSIYGPIITAKVAQHREINTSLGYGFVLFEHQSSATRCVTELHGCTITDGGLQKVIMCRYAHPRATPMFDGLDPSLASHAYSTPIPKEFPHKNRKAVMLATVCSKSLEHKDSCVASGADPHSTLPSVADECRMRSSQTSCRHGKSLRSDDVDGIARACRADTLRESRCNLYICNLPPIWNTRRLREICLPFGNILSAFVAHHPRTNCSLSYGFVLFDSEESAACCLQALDNRVIPYGPYVLSCRYARTKSTPVFKGSPSQASEKASGYPSDQSPDSGRVVIPIDQYSSLMDRARQEYRLYISRCRQNDSETCKESDDVPVSGGTLDGVVNDGTKSFDVSDKSDALAVEPETVDRMERYTSERMARCVVYTSYTPLSWWEKNGSQKCTSDQDLRAAGEYSLTRKDTCKPSSIVVKQSLVSKAASATSLVLSTRELYQWSDIDSTLFTGLVKAECFRPQRSAQLEPTTLCFCYAIFDSEASAQAFMEIVKESASNMLSTKGMAANKTSAVTDVPACGFQVDVMVEVSSKSSSNCEPDNVVSARRNQGSPASFPHAATCPPSAANPYGPPPQALAVMQPMPMYSPPMFFSPPYTAQYYADAANTLLTQQSPCSISGSSAMPSPTPTHNSTGLGFSSTNISPSLYNGTHIPFTEIVPPGVVQPITGFLSSHVDGEQVMYSASNIPGEASIFSTLPGASGRVLAPTAEVPGGVPLSYYAMNSMAVLSQSQPSSTGLSGYPPATLGSMSYVYYPYGCENGPGL